MRLPLSVLDLAQVGRTEAPRDALAGCVKLAQHAEQLGFARVWYAEHHNIPSIASSAPAVLIAHVAAHTSTIRLGAGGVMLPNHAPLTIAEQYGTLATLHPGRIDLGLGRAPGSDQITQRALRRTPAASESFPEDVLELQAYLSNETGVPGVEATPGKGTEVPLYILGSSLFGARLAAQLGLPFAFASHFAPDALRAAVAIYRREYRPSKRHATPHVIAGFNLIIADTDEEARSEMAASMRTIGHALLGRGRHYSDAEMDAILRSPAGEPIRQMGLYSAFGTADEACATLDRFATHAEADEVILSLRSPTLAGRLRTLSALAAAGRVGRA